MKVVVYTIVKDAEHYIESWYHSAKDADLLVLGDTGSTDNTVAKARSLGIKTFNIKPEVPFHFGNARNALLRRIPKHDVYVSLDADEVLAPRWREYLEMEWGTADCLSVRWIWGPTDLYIPRIHGPNARWKDRIHETIGCKDTRKSRITFIHNKDLNRDRDFYVDLLFDQYETFKDQRSRAYLGLELLSRKRFDESKKFLLEYMDNDDSPNAETALVCNTLFNLTQDSLYLYRSIHAHPRQKEAYGKLAIHCVQNKEWIHAYHMIKMELDYPRMVAGIDVPIGEHASLLTLAESAFQTGRIEEAVYYGQIIAAEFGGAGEVENLKRYMGKEYSTEFDRYKYPNWFRFALGSFKRNLDIFDGKRIRGLQIGAYTGLGSIWISNNMNCDLVDVDTWQGSDEEAHKDFDWEDVFEVYRDRVKDASVEFHRTTSDEFFETNEESFDFIYIDGDHTRAQVAKDAENADRCLKVGGVLAFDDYTWGLSLDRELRPKDAIDEFIANHSNYKILERGAQVWLQKIADK